MKVVGISKNVPVGETGNGCSDIVLWHIDQSFILSVIENKNQSDSFLQGGGVGGKQAQPCT